MVGFYGVGLPKRLDPTHAVRVRPDWKPETPTRPPVIRNRFRTILRRSRDGYVERLCVGNERETYAHSNEHEIIRLLQQKLNSVLTGSTGGIAGADGLNRLGRIDGV